MAETEKEFLSNKEVLLALSECELEGLIQWRGDEEFKLTDKGIDYAWGLWQSHSPKEKIALLTLMNRIIEAVEMEEGGDADES